VYTIEQLCELTGVHRETLTHYVDRGLLPPPSGALWTEEHHRRLLAIQKLHTEGVQRPAAIKARLDAMTGDDLARYVRGEKGAPNDEVPDTQGSVAPALPVAPPVPMVTAASPARSPSVMPQPQAPAAVHAPARSTSTPPGAASPSVIPLPPRPVAVDPHQGAMWMRHALGPGLELHVVADADARTMQRVVEILTRFRE